MIPNIFTRKMQAAVNVKINRFYGLFATIARLFKASLKLILPLGCYRR